MTLVILAPICICYVVGVPLCYLAGAGVGIESSTCHTAEGGIEKSSALIFDSKKRLNRVLTTLFWPALVACLVFGVMVFVGAAILDRAIAGTHTHRG